MNTKLSSALPIVDCRAESAFVQGHIRGATSLPAAQLGARMHELPATSVALSVCGDADSLWQASEFLTRKGYQISQKLLWTSELESELMQTLQWARGMD
ncbi:MAG: rhodanese-like domain-containing protein, partial [Thiothrix sp.]